MTNQKREYRRCRWCLWCWIGEVKCYCVEGDAQGKVVNPGWFGCWFWVERKKIVFERIPIGQK